MVKQMKTRFLQIKNRFWFRLFLRVGVIFVAFVLLLTLCNTAFLSGYYEYTGKKTLRSVSRQLTEVDLNDTAETIDLISEIQDDYGFEAEVYSQSGRTLYSSSGGQMLDYLFQGNNKLNMNHRPLKALESERFSDGSVMETAKDTFTGKEYLVYRFPLADGNTGELRAQIAQIHSSAETANDFITMIAVIFLVLALIWVLWFSRSISKPISEMNEITKKMAALDFEQKLTPQSGDEIGQLAESINDLSGKLDCTLRDLNASNAQLRDEIELEHQLDVMRRGFVANVSHELKTPIAIIQGYAEGLKLDINSASREKYCDTIMDESRRMNKLVLSLLDLSKYESGQIALNRTAFDLPALIRARAERIFANSTVTLRYDMPPCATALADPDQIDQVVKSYLENAASHVNPDGEVLIAVAPTENGGYTVSVFNTGSHIDEEIMPQIWQSFFRGDKSHNRDSGRFGLGLSIVSAIIKLHGRECGVYNTDDGVCFWFTVDRAAESPAEEAEQAAESEC